MQNLFEALQQVASRYGLTLNPNHGILWDSHLDEALSDFDCVVETREDLFILYHREELIGEVEFEEIGQGRGYYLFFEGTKLPLLITDDSQESPTVKDTEIFMIENEPKQFGPFLIRRINMSEFEVLHNAVIVFSGEDTEVADFLNERLSS